MKILTSKELLKEPADNTILYASKENFVGKSSFPDIFKYSAGSVTDITVK
jgi:hypothetical protein